MIHDVAIAIRRLQKDGKIRRAMTVDCDVIQADGGTRTASITGGFVALALAIRQLLAKGVLRHDPSRESIAAVSQGSLSAKGSATTCAATCGRSRSPVRFR